MGRHRAEGRAPSSAREHASSETSEGPKLSRRAQRIVDACFVLLYAGIVAMIVWVAAGDIGEIALRKELADSGSRVTGTVTARDASSRTSRSGGGTDYYVSYRFRTSTGQARGREDVQVSREFYRAHPAGAPIRVAYDPDAPERSSPVVLLGSVGTTTTALLGLLVFAGFMAGGLLAGHRWGYRLGGLQHAGWLAGLLGGLVIGLIASMKLLDLLALVVF